MNIETTLNWRTTFKKLLPENMKKESRKSGNGDVSR
jgi:hypothetical protein